MKRVMELLRRRRVQNVLALTASAAIILYIASSWCGGAEVPRGADPARVAAASSTSVEESSSFSDFFSGLFGRKSRGDNASPEDPALKNVQVEELPADDTDMHPDSAGERAAQGIIAIITEPLSAIGGKLSSFIMEGEMRVTVPTMVKDEKSFKEGKRYGPPVEVTGRFVYRKDSKGNYHLHQETRSSKGDTRYDGLLYNGDLYRVDGRFHFVDAKNTLREDVIESVTSDFARDGNEPAARRNWIHVFRDIKSVTEFDTLSDNGKLAAYSMKPANPERQALTIQLHSLAGRVDIQQVGPVMLEGNISGDNTYMQGYLKGSRATYRITLRIHSVGGVPDIHAP
jgi:hypothetical protein